MSQAHTHAQTLSRIVARAPVIPVIIIDNLDDAVPLARALVAGGLPVLEVTLRTQVALEAIKRILAECPEAVVGAGTILTPADLQMVAAAGAAFAVSPGATDALLDAAHTAPIPLLPGIATASEAMRLLAHDFTYAKLFPAEACGGIKLLKSLYSPLPQLRFCPTGGITQALAADYLALPNVVCVGGSWMLPAAAIAAGDWAAITAAARLAARLSSPRS
jgi:2-dehydro-3-deoxyphosphogluconate aldolase/(4S)-4-hydroxy-2-oxoglutarate aldolase